MTLLELRRNLRKACRSKTQTAIARDLGVSLSYLNAVVLGTKAPGRKILAALGLKRRMVYVARG